MGLGGVELLLALEESFGVTITDAEAEACVTPAAVTDLIFGKLRASDQRVCVSQRAFYLLRKGLRRTLGVARRHIDLDADIRSFTAGRPEREVWDDLRTAVQARHWPSLARPRWLLAVLWLLAAGAFCGLVAGIHWTAAAAGTLLVAFAGARITRPLRSRIPARYSQVRNLVPFAVTSDAVAWSQDQVASLVREVVLEQLGLRETEYRVDARLVEDWGLD